MSTATLEPPATPPRPTRADEPSGAAPRRRGRAAIALVIIVSLLLAGVTRQWAGRERRAGQDTYSGAEGASSLANMNSFALALLLGGLRGPLVMVLWTSSESQKTERNLEDFDSALRKYHAGDKVPVVVKRNGEELKLEVTLDPPR